MLDFLSSNWVWILLIGGMLIMHLGHGGGHGEHGGHDGHGGGAAGRSGHAGCGAGHQHSGHRQADVGQEAAAENRQGQHHDHNVK